MADEHITARHCLPDKDSGKFAEEQTAGQLNCPHESPSDPLDGGRIPNIALDIAQPGRHRPIQLALTFFVLAMSYLSCGLGVQVENRFIFGSLLVCFVIGAVALCISVGISLARLFRMREPSDRVPPKHPRGGEVGTE